MNIDELGMKTLTEIISNRSNCTDKFIAFVATKGEDNKVPYSEVYHQSIKLLGYMQKAGLEKGDRLIFQLESNYEFITTFWACILGGIIAVPVVCNPKEEYKHKVFRIIDSLGGSYIIGNSNRRHELVEYAKNKDGIAQYLNDNYLEVEQAFSYDKAGIISTVSEDEIAVIQYSSGSTNNPKGVVLTHKNLITNIRAIQKGLKTDENDVMLFWIPLTHDMGLIGGHLTFCVGKCNQIIMETQAFIVKPTVFLDKIGEYKATLIVTPDFGLQYTLHGVKRGSKNDFDLSSLRLIINGAEPISVDVCLEFQKVMSAFGLKDKVMYPVYGMAEATLAVAFPELHQDINIITIDRNKVAVGKKVEYLNDRGLPDASSYVDEGYPVENIEFRICDDEDAVVEDDVYGNIHIKGPSVTGYYYNDPETTDQSITKDGWLKTGDVGFICDSKLVVIGRVKDVIIINGQNYFASDFERNVLDVKGTTSGKVVASAVYDKDKGREMTAIFIVYRKPAKEFKSLADNVKKAILEKMGLVVDYVIPVKSIPKTSSGKVMRFRLKKDFEEGLFAPLLLEMQELESNDLVVSNTIIESVILEICKKQFPYLDLDTDTNLFDAGINSTLIAELYTKIDHAYMGVIGIEDLFVHTSVRKISKKIASVLQERENTMGSKEDSKPNTELKKAAIIGISARFPGAETVEEYWDNLKSGVESIGTIPEERKEDLLKYAEGDSYYRDCGFLKGGYLRDIYNFDNTYFNILNREALSMSPVQRLFLEEAFHAVEDAGYLVEDFNKRKTGVYVGYIADLETQQYQRLLQQQEGIATPTGVLSSNISGRVSYCMDLRGPSVVIDTACSSSLSAINAAYNGILQGDCEQAIVGGAQLNLFPFDKNHIGIESESGHVRPFDENADGTCEGEGIAAIIIKDYKKAMQDGDNIYGVISAVSSNQDGKTIGLSVPNPESQYDLIKAALQKAELTKDDISYIEAHGTGTKLGDPIEFNVLSKIYHTDGEKEHACAVGSVKGNIGHLYAASGLAGVIKCCLMLRHKKIPPTINFSELNKKINIDHSMLYINSKLRDWKPNGSLRRCAISNFGFSGTNCHLILEEHTAEKASTGNYYLPFILSADTKEELYDKVMKYIEFLRRNEGIRYSDLCYTAHIGRRTAIYRMAVIANSTSDLLEKLILYSGSSDYEHCIYTGQIKVVKKTGKGLKWNEITEEDEKLLTQRVEETAINIEANDELERKQILMKLCSYYMNGAKPAWKELFISIQKKRISMPGEILHAIRHYPIS